MADIETIIFPELRGIDKSGGERLWKTWVKGNEYSSAAGKVGGKLITNTRTAEAVGKKTADEQALFCAKRNWDKYIKKGYTQHHPKESLPNLSEKLEGSKRLKSEGIRPMHCQIWGDKAKKHFDFEEGVIIQPKLDGIRAIISLKDGQVSMTSRTGKEFKFLEHIKKAAKVFLTNQKSLTNQEIALDGEFYAHNIVDKDNSITDAAQRFQIITACCRPTLKRPHPLEEQMQFHVFDLAVPNKSQKERLEMMETLFDSITTDVIKMVPYQIIHDESDISTLLEKHYKEGYEGVVIRAHDLKYESAGRSLKMRKLKTSQDAEFTIVGVKNDPGVGEEHFVWVCKTDSGKTFKVKEIGSVEKRKKLYKNYTKYIGKPLTVEFQELSPEGIPRFPRSKGIRFA